MKKLQNPGRWGFNSAQLKTVALVFMTIDHLGAYGTGIPMLKACYSALRLLGRIAMPLFLFALTESLRHTRSRKKFLLRLYLAGMGTGLFVTGMNLLFHSFIGTFPVRNIFFTYFYIALYVTLMDQFFDGFRIKSVSGMLYPLLGIAATCTPHLLLKLAKLLGLMDHSILQNLISSILVSPLHVEYSVLSIFMGTAMYFAKTTRKKVAWLILCSLLCFLGGDVQAIQASSFGHLFGAPQCYMILAVPFILLYNGEKGKSHKYFFYVYYPLHRYAIFLAVYLYQMLT